MCLGRRRRRRRGWGWRQRRRRRRRRGWGWGWRQRRRRRRGWGWRQRRRRRWSWCRGCWRRRRRRRRRRRWRRWHGRIGRCGRWRRCRCGCKCVSRGRRQRRCGSVRWRRGANREGYHLALAQFGEGGAGSHRNLRLIASQGGRRGRGRPFDGYPDSGALAYPLELQPLAYPLELKPLAYPLEFKPKGRLGAQAVHSVGLHSGAQRSARAITQRTVFAVCQGKLYTKGALPLYVEGGIVYSRYHSVGQPQRRIEFNALSEDIPR